MQSQSESNEVISPSPYGFVNKQRASWRIRKAENWKPNSQGTTYGYHCILDFQKDDDSTWVCSSRT